MMIFAVDSRELILPYLQLGDGGDALRVKQVDDRSWGLLGRTKIKSVFATGCKMPVALR